jgi:hypothetical protein
VAPGRRNRRSVENWGGSTNSSPPPGYAWGESYEDQRSAHGTGELIYFMMRPEEDGDRDAGSRFWERNGDDEVGKRNGYAKPAFVEGFVDAATDVRHEAKDKP